MDHITSKMASDLIAQLKRVWARASQVIRTPASIDSRSNTTIAHRARRVSGLPDPQPGCRPCWEPPVFEYSLEEAIIQAHKNILAKEGQTEAEMRSKTMDFVLEAHVLGTYKSWARDLTSDAEAEERAAETRYFENLFREIEVEMDDLHDAHVYPGSAWETEMRPYMDRTVDEAFPDLASLGTSSDEEPISVSESDSEANAFNESEISE